MKLYIIFHLVLGGCFIVTISYSLHFYLLICKSQFSRELSKHITFPSKKEKTPQNGALFISSTSLQAAGKSCWDLKCGSFSKATHSL